MVALLVFMIATTFCPEKKLSVVHLAVTFSNIQLDICVCVCCIYVDKLFKGFHHIYIQCN